jgi:hypothetical protein
MQKESPRAGFVAMPSDPPSDHVVPVNYVHAYVQDQDSEGAGNFMAFEILLQPPKRGSRIADRVITRKTILDPQSSILNLRSSILDPRSSILFPICVVAVILTPS